MYAAWVVETTVSTPSISSTVWSNCHTEAASMSLFIGRSCPIWTEIRKSSTASGRFLKSSTYAVAAPEASLLLDSLDTPTMIPRIVHRTMLIRVTLAELITAALRKTQRESMLGSTSMGHGLIANVLPLIMKSNSNDHLLSITGSDPSFIRNRTRRKR